MKKLLLGLMLFMALSAFAQNPLLPIDFDDPADDAFVGDGGAVYSLETVLFAPDVVGKIDGGGDQWNARVDLALGTYIDMTTSNKTFTFEFYTTTTDVMTGLFQISDEELGGYAIEMQFTTDGLIGWQTITLDFNGAANAYPNAGEPVVYGNYAKLSVFTDFGFTTTGTYYFDDIAGAANGGVVVADPAPTTNASDPPPRAPEDVICIYSDYYTNISGINYNPGWGQSGSVNAAYDIGTGNNIMQYANFNYQGTDFAGNPQAAADMEYLHVDLWTMDATDVKVTPINTGTGVGEFLVPVPITTGSWSSVDLPIGDFTGMTWDNIIQMKFDGQAGVTPSTIYLDNIYFWKNPTVSGTDATLSDLQVDGATIVGFAPSIEDYAYGLVEGTIFVSQITSATPTDPNVTSVVITQSPSIPGDATVVVTAEDGITTKTYTVSYAITIPNSVPPTPPHAEADVISIYSETYTNVPGTDFNPNWGQSTIVTVDDPIAGNNTLKYENLNYQGTEYTNQDVSGYEYLHVDFWTGNSTDLGIYLISPGNEIEHVFTVVPAAWVSVDIPLTDFDPPVDLTNVFQFKVEGNGDVYFDNLYFWKTAGVGILTFNPQNGATNVAVDVDPTLSFSLPVTMADGSAITNGDIPSIITLKKTDASGPDVPFSGTIDMAKEVITVIPAADLNLAQDYYLALNNDVIRYQGGDLIAEQSVTFSTLSAPFALPVTFDDVQVNYGLSDFGGNISTITVHPSNPFNAVVESSNGAETWAGSSLAGPNGTGLDDPLPFAPGSTQMSMRVWSPTAGVPVRFKVENGSNGAISVETEVLTTVAAAWEILTFDFSNEVPGTPAINFAESYHKLVVFFDFGTVGTGELYYWDDIEFIEGLQVDLTVFLEGPYSPLAETGNMLTDLNSNGHLPTSQPFNPGTPYYGNDTPVWLYAGTETADPIPSANVVDWVLVQLRDADAPVNATSATILSTQPALLMNDGKVVGLDGSSMLRFDVTVSQNLYAVIYHRNHLGIMSNNALTDGGDGIYSYDFSSGETQVFGGTSGHKDLGDGVWGMIAADGDADGNVLPSDETSVWGVDVNGSGYLGGDYDMNGLGQASDKTGFWVPNSNKSGQVPDTKGEFTKGYQSQIPE